MMLIAVGESFKKIDVETGKVIKSTPAAGKSRRRNQDGVPNDSNLGEFLVKRASCLAVKSSKSLNKRQPAQAAMAMKYA